MAQQQRPPPFATMDTPATLEGHGVGKRRFASGPPLSLTHVDGPRGYAPMQRAEQGVRTTRFKKGFQRRHASSIDPEAERLGVEATRAEKSEKSAAVMEAAPKTLRR